MVIYSKNRSKMKNIFYALFLLSFVSCSIDNYDLPNATLSGNVVDNVTNEMVQNGGVNSGTIIQIFEGNSKQPILSTSYPDGHFMNATLFDGEYRVWAVGLFRMTVDTIDITISGNTELDIKVLPNVRLEANLVSFQNGTATINVEYEKVHSNETLDRIGVVASTYSNPNVTTFAGGKIVEQNVTSESLTSGTRTITITGLTQGKKYYFRALARSNAAGNLYNYSSTFTN